MREYYILGFLFLLLSCNHNKGRTEFEKNVEEKFISDCDNVRICRLDIKEITQFDWDTMYVFKPTVSAAEIDDILGFKYPYFQDVAFRIIFIKDNQVVYHDDYFPNFDNSLTSILKFNFEDSEYLKVSTQNAFFQIIQEKNIDGFYYHLHYDG